MTRRIVISIDLEMRWGVCDKLPLNRGAYARNLEAVPDAVRATLATMSTFQVGATWATVGALACDSWDEYFARAPTPPRYHDERLRFTPEYRSIDPEGRLHFAPDLLREIAATARQEIASHTFGHIYFREPGCKIDDVRRDARAAADVLGKFTCQPISSLVFPRNQVAHKSVLRSEGVHRWRDNPRPFFWAASANGEQSPLVRGLRLADALAPLGRRGAPSVEMRASHFVRFGLPEPAWEVHLRRIASDAGSLRRDESLHLWWHPHNLGSNVPRSIRRLKQMLERLSSSAPATSFESMRDSVPSVTPTADAG